MNDEELRAFLESATVDETDGVTENEADAPESEAPDKSNVPAADVAPRRAVPSFDELMNMPTPDEVPAPPAASVRAPEAKPAQSKPARPAKTEPPAPTEASAADTPAAPFGPGPNAGPAGAAEALRSTAPQQGNEWSQAYAQDDEQLVPLILPGFSSEPRPRRDLPPVFQAEPVSPKQPDGQHFDPSPTQPFDVINEEQTSPNSVGPRSEASPTPSRVAEVGVAAAATAAATAATSVTSDALPDVGAKQLAEDPFAMLAPDLGGSATDEGDDEYERIAVTGGVPRGRKALPWLIVGGGAVIAIIASIFVINGVRGTETPAPTTPPADTAELAPSETTPPAPKPEPSEEPKPEPEPITAPVVDPGSTWTLPIEQWEMTVEVSEKLGGSTPYTLFDGNSRVMFDSLPVASGFSEACAAARAENVWGLLKKEDGKLEVVRPEPRCTDPSDAAVYDTIWGVLDYMAKSAKPA